MNKDLNNPDIDWYEEQQIKRRDRDMGLTKKENIENKQIRDSMRDKVLATALNEAIGKRITQIHRIKHRLDILKAEVDILVKEYNEIDHYHMHIIPSKEDR